MGATHAKLCRPDRPQHVAGKKSQEVRAQHAAGGAIAHTCAPKRELLGRFLTQLTVKSFVSSIIRFGPIASGISGATAEVPIVPSVAMR